MACRGTPGSSRSPQTLLATRDYDPQLRSMRLCHVSIAHQTPEGCGDTDISRHREERFLGTDTVACQPYPCWILVHTHDKTFNAKQRCSFRLASEVYDEKSF